MENLNPEIILEILSWLSFDDVVFRCVNKAYFADIHYRHQSQLQYQVGHDDNDDQKYKHSNTTNINITSAAKLGVGLLFRVLVQDKGYETVLHHTEDYDYDDDDDDQQEMQQDQNWYKKLLTSNKIDYRMPQVWTQVNTDEPWTRAIHMVGSCNGLICFSESSHVCAPIYICNPITGEYTILPLNPQQYCYGYAIGFGYHPSTNRYKVVKILYYHANKKRRPSVGHVYVYTLGDSNGWRYKGEIKYVIYDMYAKEPGITINGTLYWHVDNDKKIVMFDLADEEFDSLSRPPCEHSHHSSTTYKMLEIGRCLCFVHQNLHCQTMDIWSLCKRKNKNDSYHTKEKEYKKSWSWTKEFSISWKGMLKKITDKYDQYRRFQPFAITKSGKVLLFSGSESILFIYDPKTGTMRKFSSDGTGLEYRFAFPHMNSFVLLKALGEDSKRIEKKLNR